MEYRKYGDTYYVRMDRGDEIISELIGLCEKEEIASATFSGIGGCGSAQIQTFIPESGEFELQCYEGMLELVSMAGNIISGENGLYHHTHAVFALMDGDEHRVAAGHLKEVIVSYTAEIELRPVIDGVIKRKQDEETGTGFWSFS